MGPSRSLGPVLSSPGTFQGHPGTSWRDHILFFFSLNLHFRQDFFSYFTSFFWQNFNFDCEPCLWTLVVNLSCEPFWWTLLVKKKEPGCPGTFKKSPRDFWTSLVPGPQDHGTFRVSRSCPVPSRDLPGTSRDGTVLLESLVHTSQNFFIEIPPFPKKVFLVLNLYF